MRTLSMLLITLVAVAAVFLSVTLGQAPNRANQGAAVRPPAPAPSIEPPEGWKRCPRCQNNQDRREAWSKYGIDNHQNNPRDLTGVWGYDGVPFGREQTPILTEWAKQVIAGRGGFTAAARTTPDDYKWDTTASVRSIQDNHSIESI